MAARYTFSVENALPLSRRDCRNINTVSTEHWKGTSSVEVHQSSKTRHLHSKWRAYTVRVEGALALWMVIITFCGRPHDVRFILSRAKPREPDVLGEDEKCPPEPGIPAQRESQRLRIKHLRYLRQPLFLRPIRRYQNSN